jgi:hypothetical protein
MKIFQVTFITLAKNDAPSSPILFELKFKCNNLVLCLFKLPKPFDIEYIASSSNWLFRKTILSTLKFKRKEN